MTLFGAMLGAFGMIAVMQCLAIVAWQRRRSEPEDVPRNPWDFT